MEAKDVRRIVCEIMQATIGAGEAKLIRSAVDFAEAANDEKWAAELEWVAELASDCESQSKPKSKRNPRRRYTEEEHSRLRFYASNWDLLSKSEQFKALSSFYNRTESQVKRMIHKYKTGK